MVAVGWLDGTGVVLGSDARYASQLRTRWTTLLVRRLGTVTRRHPRTIILIAAWGEGMGDLLIRGLAPETHEELKRRAQEAGVSLQSYVAQLLERSTAVPTLAEWLDQLDELPRHRGASGATALCEARDELP